MASKLHFPILRHVSLPVVVPADGAQGGCLLHILIGHIKDLGDFPLVAEGQAVTVGGVVIMLGDAVAHNG